MGNAIPYHVNISLHKHQLLIYKLVNIPSIKKKKEKKSSQTHPRKLSFQYHIPKDQNKSQGIKKNPADTIKTPKLYFQHQLHIKLARR